MKQISSYQPENVFHFFQEISAIPHGSNNTGKLVEYCQAFAKKRGLTSYTDAAGNLAIVKPGSKGYENAEPVILQGHLDMVCEKKSGCLIDMERESISLCSDGEFIWANQTTLGGDDGIAVAMMLAVLDDETLSHPPIEALFTNNEEVGLEGASNLEITALKGTRLINLDSEEEGVLTVSCAGAVRAFSCIPVAYKPLEGDKRAFRLVLSGLKGGHSGIDIAKFRQNGILLMGRVLQLVSKSLGIEIGTLQGGGRANVIPQMAEAVICCESSDVSLLKKTVSDIYELQNQELGVWEPGLDIQLQETGLPEKVLEGESADRIVFALLHMPDGVATMNPDVPGMVRASLNTGSLFVDENAVHFLCMIRSNMDSEKQMLVDKLCSFITFLGGEVSLENDYPAWQYRRESQLRNLMVQAYQEQYGVRPVIASIHAGLECGILTGKLGNLDMISFGPNLYDVHTPDERMEIASVERCWKYLLRVLELMKH